VEQLLFLMRDAKELYEKNGRKKKVEDLICNWACTLEQATYDKALTVIVWPLSLDDVEYEL